MSATPTVLTPLHRFITVAWPPDAAFRRFTAEMAAWWPLRTHSVGGENAKTVVFEGRVGGTIYEVARNGERSVWGTVTAWEPPGRVGFTWHPGMAPETGQDIDVRFIAQGGGTRLELTHTGWERLGALARKARRGYPIGWSYVLHMFAGRRSSPLVLTLGAVMWVVRLFQRKAA